MKFNIEDVEIKVSAKYFSEVGFGQLGQSYVMTHKPTGLVITLVSPTIVKQSAKLAALDELKAQVEAHEA